MMKNISAYLLILLAIITATGCERNDPISELGTTNGEFSAQLRVTYSNTRPALNDSVVITASSWQRDDKYDKIVFYETIYETFGIKLDLLNGSTLSTKQEDYSTLLITDTIKSKQSWKTVTRAELDNYWVTSSNGYVIPAVYYLNKIEGAYPQGAALISALSNDEFNILKGILAYSITKSDYKAIFPSAPDSYFTTAGATTQAGIDFLKANLTKALLAPAIKTVTKLSVYSFKLDIDAITPTGATTSATRTFDNTL